MKKELFPSDGWRGRPRGDLLALHLGPTVGVKLRNLLTKAESERWRGRTRTDRRVAGMSKRANCGKAPVKNNALTGNHVGILDGDQMRVLDDALACAVSLGPAVVVGVGPVVVRLERR